MHKPHLNACERAGGLARPALQLGGWGVLVAAGAGAPADISQPLGLCRHPASPTDVWLRPGGGSVYFTYLQ